MLRSERERATLRAEVARCRATADPSALMSTLIDQGDTLARENGSNRFIEAVTRESRYGMRAVRVGEASHRTDSWCCHQKTRSGCLPTVLASSADVRGHGKWISPRVVLSIASHFLRCFR